MELFKIDGVSQNVFATWVGEETLDKVTLSRLLTQPVITTREIGQYFMAALSSQGRFDFKWIERPSLAFFKIADAYWQNLKMYPFAQHEDELVFYSNGRLRYPEYDGTQYMTFIWPLMEEKIYFLPSRILSLRDYHKSDYLIRVHLGDKWQDVEVNGHTFREKMTFRRLYQGHFGGLFPKRIHSIRVLKDAVAYYGQYSDEGGWQDRVIETQEYKPFWLVRNQRNVKFLTGEELPPYSH